MNKEIGYKNIISMIMYEGNLIWKVFRSMLAVHSFLVAVCLGMVKLFPNYSAIFGSVLPFLGIILCLVWMLLTMRMFGYYGYWISFAREYEKEVLPEDYQFLTIGQKLSRGETVSIGKNKFEYRFNWHGRLFTSKALILFTIFAFICLYLMIPIVIVLPNI